MGMAVIEKLPPRPRKEVARQTGENRETIPMTMTVLRRLTFIPYKGSSRSLRTLILSAGRLPLIRRLGHRCIEDWYVEEKSIRMKQPGDIVTLGGVQ